MKARLFSLIVVLTLLLVAIPIAGTGVAFAQTTPVYISPPSQTVSPGQVFTVDIYVEPAEPIMGMSVGLSFDPALLTADSCVEGDLLNQGMFPTFFSVGTIDNIAGTISPIDGVVLGGTVSGPGAFATITFTAGETSGTSMLDLFVVDVRDALNAPVATAVTAGDVTIEEEAATTGCFIATSACGPDDANVDSLRAFRDSRLVTNVAGSAFVSTYYKLSPTVADFIDDHPALKPVVRAALLPAVGVSEAAVGMGLAVKLAIVSMLLMVSAMAVVWVRRRTTPARL